ILARRAKFIAAAVASIGIACGKTTKDDAPPAPCLSTPFVQGDASPMPCLEPTPPRADTDAAVPMPCLEVNEPEDAGAPPQACLSQIAPKPDAGATKKG